MPIRLRGAVNLKGCGGRGGLDSKQQMDGIGGRRLVYKEVVELGSNFKNSYICWFGSDSAGSIRLCVWRKSRELGGRGSPRFSTSMMESFSTDLLPAIKSYWAESHIASAKSGSTSGVSHRPAYYPLESMWSVFKMIELMIWLCWWSSSGVVSWCWYKFFGELVLFKGLSMELRYKIMSLWSGEVKWQQGCIRGIYHLMLNITELSDELSSDGLAASTSALHYGGTRSFPYRAQCIYVGETCIIWEMRGLIVFIL